MAMAAVIYIDPFCHQDPLDTEIFEHLIGEVDGPKNIEGLEIKNRAEDTTKTIKKDPMDNMIIERATAMANEANSENQILQKHSDSMIPVIDHLDQLERSGQQDNVDGDALNTESSTLVNIETDEEINHFNVTPVALKSESPVVLGLDSELIPEYKLDDFQKDSHVYNISEPITLPTENSTFETTTETKNFGSWIFNFFGRSKREVSPVFNTREPINKGQTVLGTFRCEKIDIWSFNGMFFSSGNIYQDVAARRHFASFGLLAHLVVAVYHFLCHYFTKVPFSQSVNRVIAVFSAFIWICIGSWSLYEYVCWNKTFTGAPFIPNVPPFYLLTLLYCIIAIFILIIEIIDHKGLFANVTVDEVFPTGYNHAPQTEAEYIKSVIEQIEMANIAPENLETNEFETKNGTHMRPIEDV